MVAHDSIFTDNTTTAAWHPQWGTLVDIEWRPPQSVPVVVSPPQVIQEREQKVESKRGLYQVFIVDPENGHVFENCVIAKQEDAAKFKVFSSMPAALVVDTDRDYDDYDIIVKRLGDVRPKRKITEVRVVEAHLDE